MALVYFAACFGLLFDAVVQACFFEEFAARYNHVALDYVLYPHEVLVNLHESYPVPAILGACAVSAAAAAWLWARDARAARGLTWRARSAWSGGWIAAGAAGAAVLVALPTRSFADRAIDEVAHNGHEQLWRAFATAELDYAAYYRTLPREEADARARAMVGLDSTRPMRQFPPRATPREDLDVVVVVEESFGSDFSAFYGGSKDLTPRLDEWSRRGLALTHLVADGNRTVRGLEGILCSFPPLPGDSITKRPATSHVATLAEVFQALGHDTAFVYGGRGMFDSLEPFAANNGWSEFIDQASMPDDAFYTAWGAADEWIFGRLLERQKRARSQGRRLFATLLSVSNHKPYLVPERDTQVDARAGTRDGAVAYADWALGRWLDECRDEGLLEHTLVLLVGDHGARVYGAESIPVGSYRIPALFLSPDPGSRGRRIERLCSQIDLAPTLLSLAGVSATATFFGQDLLGLPADGPGRAWVIHNRNIGLLTDEWMVVLGLQKEVSWWRRANRDSTKLELVDPGAVPAELLGLQDDATAVFQLADELYRERRLGVLEARRGRIASR
jgi:phosphoglycerol transferase MdoB-like AlkP superfamily enzyme